MLEHFVSVTSQPPWGLCFPRTVAVCVVLFVCILIGSVRTSNTNLTVQASF